MNKNKVFLPEIYKKVAKEVDITQGDAKMVCDAFLKEVLANILDFREIVFSGYFALLPRMRKGRKMIKYNGEIVYSIDRPWVRLELSTLNKEKLRNNYLSRTSSGESMDFGTDGDTDGVNYADEEDKEIIQ